MKRLFVFMCLIAAALMVSNAEAFRVTTADGAGADAELRESGLDTNRGTSTEIASRVASNRQSCIYLKFDVSSISSADLAGDITVRTTYRNNNLVESRFVDTDGTEPDLGITGWDYFLLNPGTDGEDWDELTITPNNAPAYNADGLYETKGQYTYDPLEGTKTLNSGLTYLGQKLYDSADLNGGHLPVGGAFDFTLTAGSALHDAIVAAQASDYQYVTIIMGIMHDYVAGETPANWTNFNYLFNPKEMTTLNGDPASPYATYWGSNADNVYSPMLTNEAHIPEPATMALLGFGALALLRKRK